MRFTRHQYEKAIEALRDGMTQLEPDGHCCAVCGDSGHFSWACHHNPLRAMAMCHEAYHKAQDFHDALHALIGVGAGLGMAPTGLFVAMPDEEPGEWEAERSDRDA